MRRGMTIAQKLEECTDRSPEHNGCWIWTGGFGQWGVPCTWHEGRTRSVRQLVWELKTKKAPMRPKVVTMTCGKNACLNPEHMALRTFGDSVPKFWEKVERRGASECWPWMGGLQKGYGRHYHTRTKHVFAHRFMYELVHGPIPTNDGEWCVCHRCDNPRCVNPAHLFLGRDADNIADCIAKGRNSRGEKHSEAMRRAREARKNMQASAEKVMSMVPSSTGEKK